MSTNITPQKIENRIYVTRGNSKFAIPFEQTAYSKMRCVQNFICCTNKCSKTKLRFIFDSPSYHTSPECTLDVLQVLLYFYCEYVQHVSLFTFDDALYSALPVLIKHTNKFVSRSREVVFAAPAFRRRSKHRRQ